MSDIRSALTRILSSISDDSAVYSELLGEFARATDADYAFSRRMSAAGDPVAERYRRPDSPETERFFLIEAAFSKTAVAGSAIPDEIVKSPWVMARPTEAKKNGAPIYLLFLVRAQGAFGQKDLELVEQGFDLIEPLISARLKLAEREIENARTLKELRASEEELRRLFEDSKDMIYTANAEDRIASINDAGVSLLGLSNRFDAIGRTFSDFALAPEDRAFFLERIKAKGFVRDYEIIIKRPGGEPVAFCIETAQAIKNAAGAVVAVQGIVKDISERIKNEKAILRANMELAQANQKLQETQSALVQQEKLASIGELAAGIAHEINNPLSFMKSNFQTTIGYVEALRRAWTEAKELLGPDKAALLEKKEDVAYIFEELPKIFSESEDGYSRIIEIVSQLRAFSRIDSEAKRAPYDIETGIENTLVIAWNELKYFADVRRDFAGVGPVEAEGGAVNQVLLNIIVNAAQAIASQNRKDRGLLTIATKEDEGFVYCSIADDGPGIPEEIQQRIFDPFFTTKEPGKGTGLGLSISYDIIVNKHGGKIGVRSKLGSGAVFEIAIPKKTLPTG